MALNEQRVFRANDGWWVAQVLMASAAGVTAGVQLGSGRDTVFFSTIGRDEQETRTAGMPAGHLRRLSHQGILSTLARAEPFSSFVHLNPVNTPHEAQFAGRILVDDLGLRWGHRVVQGQRLDAGGAIEPTVTVELACLDDSGLSRTIQVASQDVWEQYVEQHGSEGIKALLSTVLKDLRDDRNDG